MCLPEQFKMCLPIYKKGLGLIIQTFSDVTVNLSSENSTIPNNTMLVGRPRWLSWMRVTRRLLF